jgi:hypothetical protein
MKNKRKSVQITIVIKYESKSNKKSFDTLLKFFVKSIDKVAKLNSINKKITSLLKNELRNKKRTKKIQKKNKSEIK